MGMSYKRYKTILLLFLVAFVILALSHYFVKSENISLLFLLFTLLLSYWLLLFFFLLYARKRTLVHGNEKLAPAKLFPFIVGWIVFTSIVTPIKSLVIFKAIKSFEEKNISLDVRLPELRKSAVDNSKAASKRLAAASLHYRYSGVSINYLDENMKIKTYLPDKAATAKWLSFSQTLKEEKKMYRLLALSGILSFLSGLLVAVTYCRTRKMDNKKNLINTNQKLTRSSV